MNQGDTLAAASAIERAVFIAVEGAVGVKARAILKSELNAKLSDAGLDEERAAEVSDILRACDEARFGNETGADAALMKRAERVVKALGKLQRES